MMKLGEITIYKEQSDASELIYKTIMEGNLTPTLKAETQQGKTGVCLNLVDKLKDKFYIVYLICISDKVLKRQTRNDFIKSELIELHLDENDGYIRVILPNALKEGGNIRKEIEDKRKQRNALIILDEGHFGQGNNGMVNKWLKSIDIDVSKPKNEWVNKKDSILFVSATPYALDTSDKLDTINIFDTKRFDIITLEKSPLYFSLKELRNKGRVKQTEPLINETKILSDFTIGIIDDFINVCKEDTNKNGDNNNGNLVIRVSNINNQVEILKKLIKEKYPNIDINVFSSNNGNIERLDESITKSHERPFIAIILNGMRAGKTLTTTKYIKGWIDIASEKNDTVIQSIGRILGYTTKKDNHSKFDDIFPVYCNVTEVDNAIEYYDNPGKYIILSSVNTKTNQNNPIKESSYMLMLNKHDIDSCKIFLTNFYKNLLPLLNKNGEVGGNLVDISNITTFTVSNHEHDISNHGFNFNYKEFRTSTKGGKNYQPRIAYFDSPNPKYQNSWDNINTKYDIEGRHIHIIKKEYYDELIKDNAYSNHIFKSLLYEDERDSTISSDNISKNSNLYHSR